MSSIGAGSNPNLPEKRDLNDKKLKNDLGIEKITEIPNTRIGKEVQKIEDQAAGNGKDEILFVDAHDKLFLMEGKKMNIPAIGKLFDDAEHPLKYKGQEVQAQFIDDNEMELSERKSAFDFDEIKEVTVPLEEAIEKTHRDGIDQVYFRADNKQYVAYGKDIFKENLDVIYNESLRAGDPILFNGKQIAVDFVDDEATSFKEGFKQNTTEKQDRQAAIFLVAATAGFCLAGPMGLAVWGAAGGAGGVLVNGTVGGIRGMFNKPKQEDYDNLAKITKDVEQKPVEESVNK